VLETGSGKTLIAVLLIRHVLDQELEDRAKGMPHRTTFFMVCTSCPPSSSLRHLITTRRSRPTRWSTSKRRCSNATWTTPLPLVAAT
jgi:hypothetical protein